MIRKNNKRLYESIMRDVSKIIKKNLNESENLNEAYSSWVKAASGCYVVHIGPREIAIVPRKGDFPKSFNADSRHNLL